jgi:hypothetical protein
MYKNYLVAKNIFEKGGMGEVKKFKRLNANNFIDLTLLLLTLFKIIYYTEGYRCWEKGLLGKVGTQVKKMQDSENREPLDCHQKYCSLLLFAESKSDLLTGA